MRRGVRLQRIAAVMTLAAWSTAGAWQFAGAPIGRPTGDSVPGLGAGHGQEENDGPYGLSEMQAHQLKVLRELHQKQVIADTERLLLLATQLKAQTDQGVTASPAELKDVEEIAKLAKRLSERIKNQ